jgi:hypothetical protein
MKYRIKIEEKNDGSKEYTPQCKKNFFSNWLNIVKSFTSEHVELSDSSREIFKDEDVALSRINLHKKLMIMINQLKNKKITYKTIN